LEKQSFIVKDTARKLNENAKPKTAPNPKRRIKTVFNQFSNILARHALAKLSKAL
jgi:hypothetical protein